MASYSLRRHALFTPGLKLAALPLWVVLILACLGGPTARAQVQVVVFVPDNYLVGRYHRVVLANTTPRAIKLGGYLLVTRDYSVELPPQAEIPANGRYTIVKTREGLPNADLELESVPDFLIRLYSPNVAGNYVALFSPTDELVTAFYHASQEAIPFLPEAGTLIRADNSVRAFRVPPETDPRFDYFPFAGDPGIGFERTPTGWQIVPANPAQRTDYPEVAFTDVRARYSEGVTRLEWSTSRERLVNGFVVERSADQRSFSAIGEVAAQGGDAPHAYTYLDATLDTGRTYIYRIRTRAQPDQRVYSQATEVLTRDVPSAFQLSVYPESAQTAVGVGVRFYSAYSQDVMVQLFNAHRRELAVLYQGSVYAGSQNLQKLTAELPPGDYYVVATTDAGRHQVRFTVEAR